MEGGWGAGSHNLSCCVGVPRSCHQLLRGLESLHTWQICSSLFSASHLNLENIETCVTLQYWLTPRKQWHWGWKFWIFKLDPFHSFRQRVSRRAGVASVCPHSHNPTQYNTGVNVSPKFQVFSFPMSGISRQFWRTKFCVFSVSRHRHPSTPPALNPRKCV